MNNIENLNRTIVAIRNAERNTFGAWANLRAYRNDIIESKEMSKKDIDAYIANELDCTPKSVVKFINAVEVTETLGMDFVIAKGICNKFGLKFILDSANALKDVTSYSDAIAILDGIKAEEKEVSEPTSDPTIVPEPNTPVDENDASEPTSEMVIAYNGEKFTISDPETIKAVLALLK